MTTIRPKDNVAKLVIDQVADEQGVARHADTTDFALSTRVRALEFEAERLDVHRSEELRSQLAYARIVLKMPLR